MSEAMLITTVVGFLALLGSTLYHMFRESREWPRTAKPDFYPPGQVYRMGRLTPDRPQPEKEVQYQCSYCKRFGPPGACEGCGAPNRPSEGPSGILSIPSRKPDYFLRCDGSISEQTRQELRDAWRKAHSGTNTGRLVVLPPKFDLVKW